MKENISIEGMSYRLRPVNLDDAQFIIDIRLEDSLRNKYIHPISPDIKNQEAWIKDYLLRDHDYYFVVENKITNQKEGLIAVYNIQDQRGEWGRWVLKKGSLASIESVYLLFKISFTKLYLKEVYCRTIAENKKAIR